MGNGPPRQNKKRNRNGKTSKKVNTNAALEQMRVAKSQTNALINLANFSNPNPIHLGPFSDRKKILIVGDGDFSFSLALAIYLGGKNLIATCYDSKRDLLEKYPNALSNIDALETAGATVYVGVDATALENEEWIHEYSPSFFHSIVFNFPHLGGATEEDLEKNQELLRHFFYSTRNFLHPIQGEVLVSLRNTLFYNRWNIQEQAKRSGFKLKRTEKFDSSLYAGYEPQRTHPASFRGEPPTTSNAFTHIFVLDKTLTPEIPLTQGRANHANKLAQSKASSKKSNSSNKISSSVLQCKVCQVTLKDQKKYNAHINSAKHARKIKAAKKNQSIK